MDPRKYDETEKYFSQTVITLRCRYSFSWGIRYIMGRDMSKENRKTGLKRAFMLDSRDYTVYSI